MAPADTGVATAPTLGERLRLLRRRFGWFFLIVIAPVLVVGGYLYGFAADQYQSEAHYLVRAQGVAAPAAPTGLGALLGGAVAPGQGEAMSVSDYLTSHDVVETLRRRMDLVERFRRPEGDWLSKLSTDTPTPESLLKYYRRQIEVYFDQDTSITTLKVRAFRPQDARDLASALLQLGEQRVNELNTRAYRDAVALSRRQLAEAEAALRRVQGEVTAFRQTERDIDPTSSATAQIGLVSQLNGQLSAARAQLSTTVQLIGARNPQVDALRQQVRSLEAQLASQNSRLTGGDNTIAAGLSGYEQLRMQREFLAKRYDAASAAFEAARQQAVRQQLYIVRVVDPNLPVKSEYPRRALTLLTMLAGLLVAYGIGWLIVAGVREHAV